MALIGVDIGTTGTRAVLFSERGEVITSSYQEYAHIYPKPGWAELDPEKIWEAVQKTLREVSDSNNKRIKALAICSMGDNIVPVRADGVPVHNGFLSLDTRSTKEVAIIRDTVGEERFFQITGSPISTMSTLAKIMWLRRNRPEDFDSTWKFLTFADYILMRMGLPPKVDYSQASSTTTLDIRRKDYADTILKEIGLSGSMFAETVPPGLLLGEIPLEVRSELGLPPGVRLVMGGIDCCCGLLGSGVSQATPNTVGDIGGSFEITAYITREPPLSEQALNCRLKCYCNVGSDTYFVFTWLPSAGSVVRWFRDGFATGEKVKAETEGRNVYDVMFDPLEFNGGSILVLPYFAGSMQNSCARGAIAGLTLATSRQDMVQGIVEGITHETKLNIDRLEGLSEASLDVIRAVGGASKSEKWLQLKADITGKTVETVDVEEGSALGAALLAGVATGVYSSIEEALEITIKRKKTFRPHPGVQETYQRQHEIYRKLADRLKHFEGLSTL